jgi:NitT/TauT family transport system ATP-binding protein
LNVLDGIDLDVSAGEFLAILGPSGCGKSTLLNVLARVEVLDSGRVEYNLDAENGAKGRIAVAWQEESLMPWKTVHKNIEFPLIATNIAKTERKDRVEKWIEAVGLNGFSDYYPSQLSQGMRKRVSLAAALVSEPDLLLMDEPFSALDPYTKRQIEKEVVRLWESLEAMSVGTTVAACKGGVDDLIIEDETCAVFDPDDELSIYGSLRQLFDQPEYARQLAGGARNYLKQNHSVSKMVAQILHVYRDTQHWYRDRERAKVPEVV